MLGYHNNPAATAATLTADGWLKTGDLAQIDADGYMTIVDRVKELIKVSGFQVAPAEIEALLVDASRGGGCGGGRGGRRECGEVPKAFVVAAAGAAPTLGGAAGVPRRACGGVQADPGARAGRGDPEVAVGEDPAAAAAGATEARRLRADADAPQRGRFPGRACSCSRPVRPGRGRGALSAVRPHSRARSRRRRTCPVPGPRAARWRPEGGPRRPPSTPRHYPIGEKGFPAHILGVPSDLPEDEAGPGDGDGRAGSRAAGRRRRARRGRRRRRRAATRKRRSPRVVSRPRTPWRGAPPGSAPFEEAHQRDRGEDEGEEGEGGRGPGHPEAVEERLGPGEALLLPPCRRCPSRAWPGRGRRRGGGRGRGRGGAHQTRPRAKPLAM